MKYQFFTIPICHPDPERQRLNHFLAQHRVVNVDKQLVNAGEHSHWAFCIGYREVEGGPMAAPRQEGNGRGPRVDYRELLTEQQFALFVKLRELRKALSEQEGIPAYALFTNEQLAHMVRTPVRTPRELAKIDGVGSGRIEKYGDAFLALILQELDGAPAAKATSA
ncbi:MAG: HRDC domain-containing protein [Candidatus Competibacterales bacterium]